jgi:hypothetical protein
MLAQVGFGHRQALLRPLHLLNRVPCAVVAALSDRLVRLLIPLRDLTLKGLYPRLQRILVFDGLVDALAQRRDFLIDVLSQLPRLKRLASATGCQVIAMLVNTGLDQGVQLLE